MERPRRAGLLGTDPVGSKEKADSDVQGGEEAGTGPREAARGASTAHVAGARGVAGLHAAPHASLTAQTAYQRLFTH